MQYRKELQDDWIFNFGKYEEIAFSAVLAQDPSYILWCARTINWFKVSPEVLAKASMRVANARLRRAYYTDDDKYWPGDASDYGFNNF